MSPRRYRGYASLCGKCGHLTTRHLIVDRNGPLAGPYGCMDCACLKMRHEPIQYLSKREYEEYSGPKWDS